MYMYIYTLYKVVWFGWNFVPPIPHLFEKFDLTFNGFHHHQTLKTTSLIRKPCINKTLISYGFC